MIKKPRTLKGPAAAVWDETVRSATWLRPKDIPDAIRWCELVATMQARGFASDTWSDLRRIRRLRVLGRRLGFDPLSRAKMMPARSGPRPIPEPLRKFMVH